MMNMQTRNQYLFEVRSEYLQANKAEKGKLLDEAIKRTKLNRKHLIAKLKPLSNLGKEESQRKKRKQYYDNAFKAVLIKVWRIFDCPCGQRLKSCLKDETERLRRLGEIACSDEICLKLKEISPRTIDSKLKFTKEQELIKRKHQKKKNPLLYQTIKVKLSHEWDRNETGNMQVDTVEHCGASVFGEYINTLSVTEISHGWWEGEAVMGRGQERTCQGIDNVRQRTPFAWKEIHPDNGTEFINNHLFKYCLETNLLFSRSRPNRKNDNCFVEQKNWTHVKKFVGYLRYDTEEELNILNDLYRNELRLYKNFFQPVIKLVSKERVKGRIHRKYDEPKTPYQRVMEAEDIPLESKIKLKEQYESLNPAELKRSIEYKLNKLYQAYKNKRDSLVKVDKDKKIKPYMVRKYVADQVGVSVR